MGFSIKRAENIAYGYKEWIHKGRISYDNAVKEIKKIYREDMAREIIRILEKEIREVEEKVRWALVFSDVAEAEEAREKLSWRNIFPDSQEENKLLWEDKDEAEYAREHVGGLIEPWEKRVPRVYGVPPPEKVSRRVREEVHGTAKGYLRLNPRYNVEFIFTDKVYDEKARDTLYSEEYDSYDAAVKEHGKEKVLAALKGERVESTVILEPWQRVVGRK